MKVINKILILTSVIALLLLTACEKDLIDKIEPISDCSGNNQEEFEEDAYGYFDSLLSAETFCLDIVYPITITIENEAITVNDEEGLRTIIIEFFSNKMFSEAEINYPITATLNSDASTIIISNNSDILNYAYDCQ